MNYDVVVIGGGVHGLMTAYYLSKLNNVSVALVEQYSIGNSLGSSHGASRIVRATYIQEVYRNFMARIYQEYLPKLEEDLGIKILYRNPGIFFGEGDVFESYMKGMGNCNLDIELLSNSQIKSLFPQFKLDQETSVLYDQSGGVMASNILINALKKKLISKNVTIFENTKVINIARDKDPIVITTDNINLFAKKVVVTAGKYLSELLPIFEKQLDIIEQVVMYICLQGASAQFELGKFPQFASIHDKNNEIYYGMAELFNPGVIKLSQHVTQITSVDAIKSTYVIESERIEKLMSFIDKTFAVPLDRVIGLEKCFYTNTKDENFIIDVLPTDPRIIVGSICSGHGFKFAPLTGLILSELAMYGTTTVSDFEKYRSMFAIKNK